MLRVLRFSGLLAINFIIAVIGTAIAEAAVHQLIPVHSIAEAFWKECALSIVCAALIGFGMWRTWRNPVAKWVWVPAAAWFAFGLMALAGHGSVWGQLTGLGQVSMVSVSEFRSFFLFTVPLIRAICYSFAAYISSLLYPAQVRVPIVSTQLD